MIAGTSSFVFGDGDPQTAAPISPINRLPVWPFGVARPSQLHVSTGVKVVGDFDQDRTSALSRDSPAQVALADC